MQFFNDDGLVSQLNGDFLLVSQFKWGIMIGFTVLWASGCSQSFMETSDWLQIQWGLLVCCKMSIGTSDWLHIFNDYF